ncbi:uncharacterized protein PV09_09750 [Verruconis gallopava]|uniref:Uncharacterized protein n=1 Tax=Verruconis gallopava TaxID=253628 RepID=A0A0D1ZWN2_9PEZI|nr:uncharacterized protein PV09_09750 [Verruconis gallopava]KIV98429.1 hypothetical protein PV09_09750 [Verruconis gallopava]
MATIDLVGKVSRTPDMTANIKEEVKNLTANVQKGTAASEAATVVAKEAAEVGKTVAGMARDIKNNGTRHQTGAPMSYATAAVQGALAAGKYNVQNLYCSISSSRAAITTMSANQLKRGDLSIRTTTNSEMQTLLRTYTYGVLVHGIRTSTINMENFEEVRDTILHENRAFLPTADIKYIGWLTRQPPQKAMSLIVIEFTKPEDANRIIDENLVWQGEMCPAERYERQCRLKQCFQRQKYGHIGTQCKAAKTCGYCAQKHSSWECPTKTNREAARKWVVCHGTHEAWSRECPTRKEEVAKIKAILTTRPKYHPALTAHNEIDQRGLDRISLRRSRSTRDLTLHEKSRTSRPSSTQGRGQKRSAPAGDKENEPPSASQRPQRAYNVRKAKDTIMATLLRDPRVIEYDVLAIQELWKNPFMSTTHHPVKDIFQLCYPEINKEDGPAIVCFFINKRLDHSAWKFVQNTKDLCTLKIRIGGADASSNELAIHNVYNAPQNTEGRESTIPSLKAQLEKHAPEE